MYLNRSEAKLGEEDLALEYTLSQYPACSKLTIKTLTRCELCSQLTINTPERRHCRRSVVFIVNIEHIFQLVLVLLFLTLNTPMLHSY